MASTVSLEPDPIPLNVKVVLIGERQHYYLLHQLDPDFASLFKVQADSIPSERVMADQINKLQIKLQESQQQVREYENLLVESKRRLEAMQEDCDRQQKQILSAFVSWMTSQYRQVHH